MPTRAESLFAQEAKLAGLGQGLELRVGSQGLQQRADVVPDRRLREVEIRPISLADFPSASSSRTSICRGVSAGTSLRFGEGTLFLSEESPINSRAISRVS